MRFEFQCDNRQSISLGWAWMFSIEPDQVDQVEDAFCLVLMLLKKSRELSAEILLLLMVFVFTAPQVLL